MKRRTIKIIGYAIYLIFLFLIFGIMIKNDLIIWNNNFTLLVSALISLLISNLAEKLLSWLSR